MGKKEAEGQGINKIKTSNKTSQYPIIFPHCLYYYKGKYSFFWVKQRTKDGVVKSCQKLSKVVISCHKLS